jgi:tellurite resistance-related uncharacterized protein
MRGVYNNKSFFNTLEEIEKKLPTLLIDNEAWQSLDVDYDSPRVERVWRQHGDFRICLHRIHNTSTDTLFHNHPWPSVMRILEGSYEMGIGYSANGEKPVIAATTILSEGSSYEMLDPNSWHYVKPISDVTYSIMISGKPWVIAPPSISQNLNPLNEESKKEILDFFRTKYPQQEV